MGVAYYNEFDPFAAQWLRELIATQELPAGVVDERNLLDVDPDYLKGFDQVHLFAGIGGWPYALRLAGFPNDAKVWTGSPPCQPFSTAGKQLGEKDERHLAPYFAHLIDHCKPNIVFGEQVASAKVLGKLGGKAQEEPEWTWVDDLFDRLEGSSYTCGAADIPAAGVGAPHTRQRTFFGAARLADLQHDKQRKGGRAGSQGTTRDEPRFEPGGCSQAGWVGYTSGTRNKAGLSASMEWDEGQAEITHNGVHRLPRPDAGRSELYSMEGWASKIHPGWSLADWLFCRDGVWRPVEPGTFPLAHGLPVRVGRLRGYGNAIVPQAAATFVTSFMEVLDGY